jgi:hypothetical protein
MSLEADIAKVLVSTPVDRVNLKVESVTVDKKQMAKVSRAITEGRLAVRAGSSGPHLGASYTSWKTRREVPGQRRQIGEIKIEGSDTLERLLGRAAVFHESVHALMDLNDHKIPSMHDDEVVAYLAEALYLAHAPEKANIGGHPKARAIYRAANAIIVGKGLMARKSQPLSWSDCAALKAAIKAHPAY